MMQVITPYLSAAIVLETLILWHSYLDEKSDALKCVLLWEWIAWRSNQRDSNVYYDKAVERVLHYAFVRAG